MLRSLRPLRAIALSAVATLLFAASASAQDTPVGGLQQLPPPDDCISTEAAATPECGTIIAGGTTDAVSIAVTPDGKNAYVASSGSENPGSLATFTRNAATGELSFNRCVRDPSSAEVCAAEVTQLQGASYVVATNEHVYVASSGSDAVRGFSRDQSTGALTPLPLPGGCIQAIGAGGCTDGHDGLNGVEYLVLSNDGEFLYAISEESGTIVVLDRDPATGALSHASATTQTGVRAADVGRFHLYAVSPTQHVLVKYDRNEVTGALIAEECYRGTLGNPLACGGTTPEPATPGINGAYDVEVVTTTGGSSDVYVVGRAQTLNQGSTLATFDRDTTTGDLTFSDCFRDNEATGPAEATCDPVNGILDATSVTARPDGAFLYVTGTDDNAIAYFARDTSTGTLTQYGGADEKCVSDGDAECGADSDTEGLTGVNETAVAPDGRFLYSTSPEDDAVAEFAIQYAPACPNITRDDVPAQTTVDITPTCTDPNQPRDQLTIRVRTQPPAGQGTVEAVDTNNDGRADTLRYNPGNYIGTTTFTYDAIDDQGNDSPDATVTVTVSAAGAPVISISDAAREEGNSGTSNMTFTVQRSGPTDAAITVTYVVEEDTAVEPQDFQNPATSTVTFEAGETTETINVPIVGDTLDEETERFRVRITNAEESTGPDPAISDDVGIGTIADDDTAVASIGDVTVAEDGGPATLTVTLSTASTRTVTVDYAANEGSATSPEDFTAPPAGATVSFAPGDTSETISIPLVDDTAVEQTEQFTVALSNPTSGATLGDATGQVTINDDEVPAVSVSDAAIAEGDSGTRDATFTLTLSSPTSSQVSVNYATAAGTATTGTDYDARSGTVTFAPGETTKTVAVPVRGDTTEEADETFTVTLSNPVNATIGDGSGAGTIQNDDRAPAREPEPPAPRTTIVVGDTGIAEGDAGVRNATFTIALSQAASAPVSVDVTTADGTARAGSDYNGGSGRVTFAPGETTKPVPIQVLGDERVEADEQFTVRLSNAAGADIVKAVGTGTIANDDIRRRLPGLRFSVRPARDLTLPHVFTVIGRVVLPAGVSAAEGCGTGRVSAQYKNRGNTISTRRAVIDERCRFTIRTPFNVRSRLRSTRRLKLTVRFLGNRYLSPRTAQAVYVRIR